MLAPLLSLIVSAWILAGPPAEKASATTLPAEAFVDEKPQDAKSVAEVKKNAKEGDKIVFEAKVGGRPEPFVKNRAIFLVADRTLKICGEEDTDCTSGSEPCCGSEQARNQKLLTVQFVDKDGKPLRVGAEGVRGLESRAKIVVAGTVAKVDDKGNVTVSVNKIYVEKPTEEGAAASASEPASQGKPGPQAGNAPKP
jgi:hypothetical protein